VNTLRTDSTALLGLWQSEKVECEAVTRSWFEPEVMFELKSHPSLRELPTFQKGFFYVQDPSTLLAVTAVDPQPGERVLDLCAAPGGKTVYMAQRMQNRGRIVAQDLQPQRLALVKENCQRLGVTCVETTLTPDSPAVNPAAPFDRVLVDAPCSNTGVLRRRVDLRWRVRQEELGRLQSGQLDLLRRAARQLKPGGRLVYSTCSLEPEENRQTVESFLAEHPHFALEAERDLLPFRDGVDGAYVASLRHVTVQTDA
jgi:16S rRNA (cytosine967-C5)-methyltransferase